MYRCEDEERRPLWQRVENKVGAELTDSIKTLYDVYDSKMIEWMASLYDHSIGGCPKGNIFRLAAYKRAWSHCGSVTLKGKQHSVVF